MTVPQSRILLQYDINEECKPLASQLTTLYHSQARSWEQLRNALELLQKVEERTITIDGCNVVVQWNPQRRKNVEASPTLLNKATENCMLCINSLPQQQVGILYNSRYLILCNPAPIFRHHFTVISVEHQKQEFLAHLPALLSLSKNLDNTYTVLYNGPACGASVPFHFHFQLFP